MTGRRMHPELVKHDPIQDEAVDREETSEVSRQPEGRSSSYRRFWADVGSNFPDLDGARSTAQYLADEQWLFRSFLAPLPGLRVLKTDLWDEAKNTRILRWAAAEGMEAWGVDISLPIVRRAYGQFTERALLLNGVVADVRSLPFQSASFDAIYSMGTIEHFDETEAAVREVFRVLKPGGRAVVGVPNRWDPFLRPLLVALLYRLGLYGYGFEKSYSRRALRRMLERAGFEVTGEAGILFIPGWLRMLDLACHARAPGLGWITRMAVSPFASLSSRFPWIRRYGYLLTAVGVKPALESGAGR